MSVHNGSVSPAEFPPPVNPADEFVGPITDAEDERIEVGVAIVGGGQAGLACAIRLLQLLGDDEELTEKLGEVPVAVIEKGKVAGAHQLSGAVMNPSAIQDLVPGDESWPHYGPVGKETVYFMLNRKRAVPLKPTPPPFRNHGNYVISVAELNRWLAEKAEEAGAYILTETTGAKLLVDERSGDEASGRGRSVVRGVRTGDKGRDKEGGEKSNFEPGSDVVARATVLAEGNWGHLTGAAVKSLGLGSTDPQVWALGVKEVWEVEKPLDRIIHTLGWPLRPGAKWKEFGGSWIYPMNREGEKPRVSIGFVTGLDYADARLSVHDVLQEFKLHPLVRKILGEGKRVAWGAKAIPEGGYWAMPKLCAPGMVIAGDAAGMVNVPKLKGVHYAIRAGMLAAETIYKQLKAGSTDFSDYEKAVHDSEIGKDLWESRNMKQPFGRGLVVGGAITNAMVVTKGRFPGGHWPTHRDAEQALIASDRNKRYPKPDGKYTFDKLSGVFLTGNATRDDAPSHIRIEKRVPREVAEGWAWMCPAGVYEVPEDAPEEGYVDLIVNPSNCVQCGAITAKGGRLTPPEGGDGPMYQIT
jgi:electron-transferring-flavoprotein dehydrogenase